MFSSIILCVEKSTSKRLRSFDRRTLEFLAKKGGDDDVQNYTDEELVEAVYDIYPNDAILSMQFARDLPLNQEEKPSSIKEVPLYFMRTSIDVIPFDLHWFYVFWSISPNEKAELLSKDIDTKLSLRITDTKDASLKSDRFILHETDCTFQESERNVYIQKDIYNLTIELVAEVKGEEKILAKSYTYDFVKPLITDKVLSKKANKLMLLPLINKDDNLVVNNQIITEYYDKINEDKE